MTLGSFVPQPEQEVIVPAACFSPDGTHALANDPRNGICLWRVQNGKKVRDYKNVGADGRLPGAGNGVTLSPDGRRAISGGDGVVVLWDVETGEELKRLTGHAGQVWCVAFSPDGQRALSGSQDGTVRLWNVAPH
jgi:WD40 repeat protein